MLMATSTDQRLISAAEAAGLKQTKKGLFGTGKKKADWSLEIDAPGRLTVTRRWDKAVADLLSTHATWHGPVKLQRDGDAVFQRLEIFLGQLLSQEQCMTRDEDEQARVDAFLADILAVVPAWLDGLDEAVGWNPPPAQTLSNWLIEAGHEAAIDKEENLRLALKRRGCDGQIRVERAAGRLRFTMLLGEWRQLDDDVKRAMFDLADEANARSRLVRIAWVTGEEDDVRCDAQVDLSGLPFAEPLEEAGKTMWGEMIRATIDGLELALRRLGLELNGLAEPDNRELAEAYSCKWH